MKKFKVSIVALVAIFMAIGGSAFTAATTAPTVDEWFLYDGSGSVNDPSNYNYTGSISSCSANVRLCAFKGQRQASPNQNMPTQTSVNSASSASSNFTVPVTNIVVFKP